MVSCEVIWPSASMLSTKYQPSVSCEWIAVGGTIESRHGPMEHFVGMWALQAVCTWNKQSMKSRDSAWSNVTSCAVKRNFWLHAICAGTEQHSTYQIRWENWWFGLRVWCLGKCFGLGFEKENNLSLRLSPIFFSGYSYFRTVACCGYLTSYQKVLIYTRDIKKVIVKIQSFTPRSQITDKQN